MGSEIFCLIQGLDCKTVRFFLKICKEIGNRGVRVLRARASHARRACEAYFFASLPSFALCFQPRSRPFVWLLARTFFFFLIYLICLSRVLEYAKIRAVSQSNRVRFWRLSEAQPRPNFPWVSPPPPQDSTNLSQLFRSSRAAIRNKWHLYFPLDSWDWTLTAKVNQRRSGIRGWSASEAF